MFWSQMCLHSHIKEINFEIFESIYFLDDWMHWNSNDCFFFFLFDPVVFKFYLLWLIFMHTEYTSAQCRTLSPDYLLMFSNEVCMWAWFQGNIHDAHVGTANHRRNQKLSRDPLRGLWEAFERREREQSGKKNERRGSAVSSRSKTLEELTSLDQWWCFQGLWGHMWPDTPGGWGCGSCMWAVSPLRARIGFSLWPFLDPEFEANKSKELCFRHRSSNSKSLWTKLCAVYTTQNCHLAPNLRIIVTYKASKCILLLAMMPCAAFQPKLANGIWP